MAKQHSSYFMALCCCLIILFTFSYFNRIKKYLLVKRWQRHLNLTTHATFFNQLYQDIDGFTLSRQARQERDAINLIYGEIEFISFTALLSLAKPTTQTVFYDLGCGVGKAVIACALVYPVQKSIGIEILPELYLAACTRQHHLTQALHPRTLRVAFILGDLFAADLNDATLIFINASTFVGSLWLDLCALIDQLPAVQTVITISKPLQSTYFSPSVITKVQMSWGIVKAYIQQRKDFPTKQLENIE